ncbi:MAG TPA: acyl dehydratase, partial [Acidobacteria bacterium]|nr:acyl dehydratase [Acidobacteriota bacterium]
MTQRDRDTPLPVPTAESRPYWDGLRAHRL